MSVWEWLAQVRSLSYVPLRTVENLEKKFRSQVNLDLLSAELYRVSKPTFLSLVESEGVCHEDSLKLYEALRDDDGDVDIVSLLSGLALLSQAESEDKVEFLFRLFDMECTGELIEDQVLALVLTSHNAVNKLLALHSANDVDDISTEIERMVNELFLHAEAHGLQSATLEMVQTWAHATPAVREVLRVSECVHGLDCAIARIRESLDAPWLQELNSIGVSPVHEEVDRIDAAEKVIGFFIKALPTVKGGLETIGCFYSESDGFVMCSLHCTKNSIGVDLFGSQFDLFGLAPRNESTDRRDQAFQVAETRTACIAREWVSAKLSYVDGTLPGVREWCARVEAPKGETMTVKFQSGIPSRTIFTLDPNMVGQEQVDAGTLLVVLVGDGTKPVNAFSWSQVDPGLSAIGSPCFGRRLFVSDVHQGGKQSVAHIVCEKDQVVLFVDFAAESPFTISTTLTKKLQEITAQDLVVVVSNKAPLLGCPLSSSPADKRLNEEVLHCFREWHQRMLTHFEGSQVTTTFVFGSKTHKPSTSIISSENIQMLQVVLNEEPQLAVALLAQDHSLKESFALQLIHQDNLLARMHCFPSQLRSQCEKYSNLEILFGPLVLLDGTILLQPSESVPLSAVCYVQDGPTEQVVVGVEEKHCSATSPTAFSHHTCEPIDVWVDISSPWKNVCPAMLVQNQAAPQAAFIVTNSLFAKPFDDIFSWQDTVSSVEGMEIGGVLHLGGILSLDQVSLWFRGFFTHRNEALARASLVELVHSVARSRGLSTLLKSYRNGFLWDLESFILNLSPPSLREDHDFGKALDIFAETLQAFFPNRLDADCPVEIGCNLFLLATNPIRRFAHAFDALRSKALCDDNSRRWLQSKRVVVLCPFAVEEHESDTSYVAILYDCISNLILSMDRLLDVVVLWPAKSGAVAWTTAIVDRACQTTFQEVIVPPTSGDIVDVFTTDQSKLLFPQNFQQGRYRRERMSLHPHSIGYVLLAQREYHQDGIKLHSMDSVAYYTRLAPQFLDPPTLAKDSRDLVTTSKELQLVRDRQREIQALLKMEMTRAAQLSRDLSVRQDYFDKYVDMLNQTRAKAWKQRKIEQETILREGRTAKKVVELAEKIIQALPSYYQQVLVEKRKAPVKEQVAVGTEFSNNHDCAKWILEMAETSSEAKELLIEKVNALHPNGQVRIKGDGTFAFSESLTLGALNQMVKLFSKKATQVFDSDRKAAETFALAIQDLHRFHEGNLTPVGTALMQLRTSLSDSLSTLASLESQLVETEQSEKAMVQRIREILLKWTLFPQIDT